MTHPERQSRALELRHWLATRYFTTPDTNAIMRDLTATVDRNRVSPPGAKTISAITGLNGLGKSTLVRRWAEELYKALVAEAAQDRRGRPVWSPTGGVTADLCPIAWANLQAGARVKELDAQILEFFGLPSEGVARTLTNRVVRALERHQVRVLIVDDAHLLRTSSQQGRDVLDHLKHLNTQLGEFGGSIVLVGADLEGGAMVRDPQIEARLRLHTVRPCDAHSEYGRKTWQGCILKIESMLMPHLPALQAGDLYRAHVQLLWDRTGGRLGQLGSLLSEAAELATVDGSGWISGAHIAAVRISDQAEREYKELLASRRPYEKAAV